MGRNRVLRDDGLLGNLDARPFGLPDRLLLQVVYLMRRLLDELTFKKIGQNRFHDPAPQTRGFLTGTYYAAKWRLINPPRNRLHCRQTLRQGLIASLDELLARLLQYALLEIGPLAEELLVRRGGGVLRVFDCRELHGADVVRRLRKPVLGGLRRSVDDGVLRQRVLDRAMECWPLS